MTTMFQPGDLVAPTVPCKDLAGGTYFFVERIETFSAGPHLCLRGHIGHWPAENFVLIARRGSVEVLAPRPAAISRRDYFAGQALLGLTWHDTLTSWDDEHPVLAQEDLVWQAVELADALIARLDGKEGAE